MSPSALETLGTRLAYGLSQAPRIAWYLGHGIAMRRLGRRYVADRRPRRSGSSGPGDRRLYEDLARLFGRDLANVESGIYPVPEGEDGTLADRIEASRMFFADLPEIARRRSEGRGQEVLAEGLGEGLPRYYRQNFHFQTDGWLSDRSARLYDHQVEVLFAGAANAMRRQALVPVAGFIRGRDQRRLKLLDIACGTGRFLKEVRRAFPMIPLTGLDLSEAYLAEARRSLADSGRLSFVMAPGESMPFRNGAFDLVTSVFLFHELPPAIRRQVAREAARVLRPGGRLVLLDSLQRGDMPGYDGMLERFPEGFHEPYYAGYLGEDLIGMFAEAGLRHCSTDLAWLSKVVTFERPAN